MDRAEEASGVTWGRVSGERPDTAECWIRVHTRRWTGLVPVVRVNRWTDPQRLYVLADGSLYCDPTPPRLPVCAWVVEDERPEAR